MNEILLGPEISFRGLDRCVAKGHPNLLKLAATCPAQLRASTAEIMRRDARDSG